MRSGIVHFSSVRRQSIFPVYRDRCIPDTCDRSHCMFYRLPYVRHNQSKDYKQAAHVLGCSPEHRIFRLRQVRHLFNASNQHKTQPDSIQDINVRRSHSPPFSLRLTVRRHKADLTRRRRRILVDDVVAVRSSSGDITACADLFRARGRITHGEQRARRRTTRREGEWLLNLQHLRLISFPKPLSCECCLSCRYL